MLGLAGYSPASINPDVADDDFSKIITEGILMLNGEKSVKFHLDEDLIFYKEIELPCHPNGMTIQAYGVPDEEGGDNLLLSETYYSIGGGFIRTEAEMIEELINKKEMDLPLLSTPKENISLSSLPRSPESSKMVYDTDPASPLSTVASPTDSTAPTIPVKPAHPTVPFFFKSAQELLQLCKANKMSIAEIMVKNECVLRNISTDEVYSRLDQIAAVIDCCVERGLRMEGTLPVSGIPRRSGTVLFFHGNSFTGILYLCQFSSN